MPEAYEHTVVRSHAVNDRLLFMVRTSKDNRQAGSLGILSVYVRLTRGLRPGPATESSSPDGALSSGVLSASVRDCDPLAADDTGRGPVSKTHDQDPCVRLTVPLPGKLVSNVAVCLSGTLVSRHFANVPFSPR